MKQAVDAPWSLPEFLKLKPSRWKTTQYYSFTEETVRSIGQRYIGRFDRVVLHWEEAPVLDLVIEHKFPIKHLPEESLPEDIFQAGLYALALYDTGVSCSGTRLINIYCLQVRAKRCFESNSTRSCLKCSFSKVYLKHFDPTKVIKALKRMDEVWYNHRDPKPSPEQGKCRACQYSRGKCSFSAV
jgi:hypothetical protein